ncbi:hypothetical protein [Geodermatophilus marinus]|uniref:hypothetical protein n=1 Tax=Geodermatophilus sp. LHW52908 TaxID=2303986 RepID=UPI0011C0D3F0|nr:hypothetical protein [Geodermatophilus sp. LHW52908]
MTAAWIALGLIAVGLPLLAWWVGGRAFWRRLRPGAEPDTYRAVVRRHGLRPAEAAQVEGAVTWGRELADPRLRAAVVDWAQELQRLAEERRERWAARRLLVVLVLLAYAGLLGGAVLRSAVRGEWGPLLSGAFWALVWVLPGAWLAGGPRRAIERNSGPPPES